MSTGKLVVLSAPSGTGKTSVCKKLLKRNPNWKFSVSATTRPLREDEVDGKDYIQMSNDKFEHFVNLVIFWNGNGCMVINMVLLWDPLRMYLMKVD